MIVFPMAGLSSRFTKAGYDRPKYMLPLWGGTVFDHAVRSFAPRFAQEQFLFIYRETGGAEDFIRDRLAHLGVRSPVLARLEHETAGQAETVEFGLDRAGVADDEALTIFNIDTFRKPGAILEGPPASASGWLEVFHGEGANWSYVKPDPARPGFALQTTEKVPVSDLCCTGLYHFSSAAGFGEALRRERAAPQMHELYVAPIYNHLIGAGEAVGYAVIANPDVVFCGVPDEYEALRAIPAPW